MERGKLTSIASAAHSASGTISMKVKLAGTSIKVWVAGTLKIDTTDSAVTSGGIGLAGDKPKFSNIKAGYDTTADNDIDDAGDDIVYDDDFSTASATLTHDNNGNLTDDGTFKYTYDAWNRLVAVKTQHDRLTLATYEFDATGRRIKKVVTNSAPHDGTVVYLYDGWQIAETRDGSGNMKQQFIHGTQYIDELVMIRVKDKGDLYIHQAERSEGKRAATGKAGTTPASGERPARRE